MSHHPIFERVTVFGGITVDRMARTGAPPIAGASNPGTVRAAPGGVGFNVARTLARLGLKVRFAGAVGDDADGGLLLGAAKQAGIDTGATIVSGHAMTAAYHAAFDHRGDLVIGVADTAIYETIDPTALAGAVAAARRDGFWIVDANFTPETLGFLLREAAGAGHPVAALCISPAKAVRFASVPERPSYLFANRREAAAMLGGRVDDANHRPEDLAAELGRMGFVNVLVTNSAEPIHVAAAGEIRSLAPPSITVGSVNGAGDAFTGGTIYGLSLGKSLFEAASLGLATAALTAESDETVRSDLTPALLARRLAREDTA